MTVWGREKWKTLLIRHDTASQRKLSLVLLFPKRKGAILKHFETELKKVSHTHTPTHTYTPKIKGKNQDKSTIPPPPPTLYLRLLPLIRVSYFHGVIVICVIDFRGVTLSCEVTKTSSQ